MSYTVFQPERNRRILGVLFDLDGIILDTEKLYTRFWQEAAWSMGYSMTREQSLGMRSLNHLAGEKRMKQYFGPDTDYHALRSRRIAMMDAYIAEHGVEPKPGIFQLLEELDRRNIPRAITTASPLDRVKQYLTPLGLPDRFQAICTVYDVAQGKPAPDIYLHGARTLGLDPGSCLALEDSSAGIQSASAAGCLTVMIPDQDVPCPEDLPRLYALADSLTDVIGLLG